MSFGRSTSSVLSTMSTSSRWYSCDATFREPGPRGSGLGRLYGPRLASGEVWNGPRRLGLARRRRKLVFELVDNIEQAHGLVRAIAAADGDLVKDPGALEPL